MIYTTVAVDDYPHMTILLQTSLLMCWKSNLRNSPWVLTKSQSCRIFLPQKCSRYLRRFQFPQLSGKASLALPTLYLLSGGKGKGLVALASTSCAMTSKFYDAITFAVIQTLASNQYFHCTLRDNFKTRNTYVLRNAVKWVGDARPWEGLQIAANAWAGAFGDHSVGQFSLP
jgi:hypothetical protein